MENKVKSGREDQRACRFPCFFHSSRRVPRTNTTAKTSAAALLKKQRE